MQSRLRVVVSEDRAELGAKAAEAIAAVLRQMDGPFSIAFAAAPSQDETLHALGEIQDLPWRLSTAFHLDEYVGLDAASPQSFRRYVLERIVKPAGISRFEGLRGEAPNLEAEMARYSAALLAQYPQLGCIGIGENGHLAFNDPPMARFDDTNLVRHVELTRECREQQVHDGTFPDLASVPTHALTLSIQALVRIPKLFVMVPGALKARAVRDAVAGPVTEACPASVLQRHPDATLFLDRHSAALF